MKGMMLHCGAEHVSRQQILESATPHPTATWQPVSHGRLLETTRGFLEGCGMKVVSESHGLTKDGARYFGMLEVQNGVKHEDYSVVVGVRNSHDKKFRAELAVGATVFVCDNLSFSGEVTIARKHTRWVNRDLPGLISRAVGKLGDVRRNQDQRIAAYKETDLTDLEVHDIVVRAVDSRVMPVSVIPRVLKEWREPRHDEFKPRTGWSLFNAFTEAIKGRNIMELPARTQRLHGLLDSQFSVAG